MNRFPIKWKGRETGPFTEEEILAKLGTREISPMHEIFAEGEWKTIRVFQRDRKPLVSTRATPAKASPAQLPPPLPLNQSEPETVQEVVEPVATSDYNNPSANSSLPPQLSDSAPEGSNDRSVKILIYAGFWSRSVAAGVDALLMAIPPAIVLLIAGVNLRELPTQDIPNHILAIAVGLAILVSWIYFAILESSTYRASIGKIMVGLVVNTEDGNQLSFGDASIRYFSKTLSAAMVFAGFFLAAFTRQKQGFHDLVAKSTVNYHFDSSRIFSPPRETQLITNTYSQEYGESLF